jgi:hypothetical protein
MKVVIKCGRHLRLGVIGIGATLLAFGARAESCPEYVGQSVKLLTYAQARSQVPMIPKKSEFETNQQFKARIDQAAANTPLIIAKPGPASLSYDADKGGFRVDRTALGVEGYRGVEAIGEFEPLSLITQNDFDITLIGPLVDSTSVILSDTLSPAGAYTGANGFGAKAAVRKYNETISGLLHLGAEGAFDVGASYVAINVDEAKALKPNLRIAYVFSPSYPFTVKGDGHSGATLDDPRDIATRFELLAGQVRCALLVRGTDSHVIAALSVDP